MRFPTKEEVGALKFETGGAHAEPSLRAEDGVKEEPLEQKPMKISHFLPYGSPVRFSDDL